MQGVSTKNIMQDARTVDTDLKRVHLLSRKDVQNFRQAHGINVATATGIHTAASDSVSVSGWIEEMEKLDDDSPVLFYKPQETVLEGFANNDFMLVIMNPVQRKMLQKFGDDRLCVDSTHGMTGYDFELTTLLIVDEYDEGFPVAFFCSSSVTTAHLKLLFNCIKRTVGEIKPQSFMTDDAPAFYNAWSDVMGPVQNRLLCTWHVDRAWQGKLQTITNKDTRQAVYKSLRACHTELNRDKFVLMFAELLQQLKNDPETTSFAQYLESHYSSRPETWAYSYRIGANINTNMHIENFHKIIKHIYMEGKKSKRVDKCIDALFAYLLDKQFDRLTKLQKGKLSTKVAAIVKRHSAGVPLAVSCIQSEKNVWNVPSATVDNLSYTVVKSSTHGCSSICALYCRQCQTCLRGMSCTCHDYLILGNMCKHIHAAGISQLEAASTVCSCAITPVSASDDVNDEIKFHVNSLKSVRKKPQHEALHKLSLEIMNSLTRKTEIPDSIVAGVDAHLRAAKRLLQMIKYKPNDEYRLALPRHAAIEPANKLASHQKRFFSVRRARSKKVTLNKASAAESATLGSILLQEELLINTGELDHCYRQKIIPSETSAVVTSNKVSEPISAYYY